MAIQVSTNNFGNICLDRYKLLIIQWQLVFIT